MKRETCIWRQQVGFDVMGHTFQIIATWLWVSILILQVHPVQCSSNSVQWNLTLHMLLTGKLAFSSMWSKVEFRHQWFIQCVLYCVDSGIELGTLKGTYSKAIKQKHQGHLVLKNTLKLETILGLRPSLRAISSPALITWMHLTSLRRVRLNKWCNRPVHSPDIRLVHTDGLRPLPFDITDNSWNYCML